MSQKATATSFRATVASMSTSRASRSHDRSLSVKQLIDERIKKLEEQQISEIASEYSQKHASLVNSMRIKNLRVSNVLGPTDELEGVSMGIQSEIKVKLRILMEKLKDRAESENELAIDKDSMGTFLQTVVSKTADLDHLIDIDLYLEEILKFDEYCKNQFSEHVETRKLPAVEQLVFSRVTESLNAIVLDGVCGALTRGHFFDNTSAESDDILKDAHKLHKHFQFRHLPQFSQSRSGVVEGSESAKLLMRKLQSSTELEYNIQRQVDEELSTVDSKYLKLIAETASSVYAVETKLGQELSSGHLDPLWIKKVIPAILKSDESLAKDVIDSLSRFVSANYESNRRINKLVQIESAKSTFN